MMGVGDATGNVWITNSGNTSLSVFSSLGAVVGAYSNSALNVSNAIAIDNSGNAWVPNLEGASVREIATSNGGAVGNYTDSSFNFPDCITFDGAENIWVANSNGTTVSELASNGGVIANYTGGGSISDPGFIAIDGSGNAWISNFSSQVTELIGGRSRSALWVMNPKSERFIR